MKKLIYLFAFFISVISVNILYLTHEGNFLKLNNLIPLSKIHISELKLDYKYDEKPWFDKISIVKKGEPNGFKLQISDRGIRGSELFNLQCDTSKLSFGISRDNNVFIRKKNKSDVPCYVVTNDLSSHNKKRYNQERKLNKVDAEITKMFNLVLESKDEALIGKLDRVIIPREFKELMKNSIKGNEKIWSKEERTSGLVNEETFIYF